MAWHSPWRCCPVGPGASLTPSGPSSLARLIQAHGSFGFQRHLGSAHNRPGSTGSGHGVACSLRHECGSDRQAAPSVVERPRHLQIDSALDDRRQRDAERVHRAAALSLRGKPGSEWWFDSTTVSGYLQQSRLTRSGYPTLLLWNGSAHLDRAAPSGGDVLGIVPWRSCRGAVGGRW
jgi:hypothetical protein